MPYSNVELLLKLVAKLTRGERVEFYLRLKERYYGAAPPPPPHARTSPPTQDPA